MHHIFSARNKRYRSTCRAGSYC